MCMSFLYKNYLRPTAEAVENWINANTDLLWLTFHILWIFRNTYTACIQTTSTTQTSTVKTQTKNKDNTEVIPSQQNK